MLTLSVGLEDKVIFFFLAEMLLQLFICSQGCCWLMGLQQMAAGGSAVLAPLGWAWLQEGVNLSINLGREVFRAFPLLERTLEQQHFLGYLARFFRRLLLASVRVQPSPF